MERPLVVSRINHTLSLKFTDELEKAVFLDALETQRRALRDAGSNMVLHALETVIGRVKTESNWKDNNDVGLQV